MASSPWAQIRKPVPERTPTTHLVSASDLFVVNSDAKSAQSHPGDPIYCATTGQETAIIPFNACGYPFFDLFLFVGNSSTTPTTPYTTPVKVRAFGMVRQSHVDKARLLPDQFDSTNFDLFTSSIIGGNGHYIPLFSAGGVHEQVFGATPEISDVNNGGKPLQITSSAISYFTKDTENILVVVSQALVATNAGKAMLLASLGTS